MLQETETHAPRKEQVRQHRGTRDQLYTMRMHVNTGINIIEMLCRCSYNSDIVDLGRKSRDSSGKKGSYETIKVKKVRNPSTECTIYNALYTNSYTKLPPPIRLPPHSLGVNQDRVHC